MCVRAGGGQLFIAIICLRISGEIDVLFEAGLVLGAGTEHGMLEWAVSPGPEP